MMLSMLMIAPLMFQEAGAPAAAAQPQAEPPAAQVRTPPSWAVPVRPAAAEIAFKRFRQDVRVQLMCGVLEDGSLTDCQVLSARPEPAGPAALPLTRDMRVQMGEGPGGGTAGDRVAFVIRWTYLPD